jgi:hypothetical protein
MSKGVKLSMIGATGAVMCFAGGSVALAGPVGLADAAAVAPPAATESVHYRRAEGRSAHYCPPRKVERRTVYVRKIIERRTAYVVPRTRYIVERRTAYVAAPVTAVAVPVVAATYPGYGGYGGGGQGLIGAGAGLLGGVLNIGFGGGGWGGPGWGGGSGWGGGWRRGGWW